VVYDYFSVKSWMESMDQGISKGINGSIDQGINKGIKGSNVQMFKGSNDQEFKSSRGYGLIL